MLTFAFLIVPAHAESISSLWQTEKSQHFIIYYQNAPAEFIDELVYKAEDYYNSIMEELGFRRFDFWTWDNRAKIYLYNDKSSYLKETQDKIWSAGQVSIRSRVIKTFIGQNNFFDSILPHEMTHIIFRDLVVLKARLPLWIDEGVACSQEKSNLPERMKTAKSFVENGAYLKLDRLSEIFSLNLIVPELFYSESASLIVFLMSTYGKESFLDFSRKLRDGEEWQEAILNTYRFSNLAELETAWKNFILQQEQF